jgi:hypothetical protein
MREGFTYFHTTNQIQNDRAKKQVQSDFEASFIAHAKSADQMNRVKDIAQRRQYWTKADWEEQKKKQKSEFTVCGIVGA